jgi:hypothetical protein
LTRYEKQGRIDAQEGRTSCPYGVPAHAAAWSRGHDRAVAEGLGSKPRFALTVRKRPRPSEQEALNL